MSPKGRGSNQRRRTRRQKLANQIAALHSSNPTYAANYNDARQRRMVGRLNPANFLRGRHPLERHR